MTSDGAEEAFDAAARELCPDGNCTGVLDAAGVCKVCGLRAAAGDGADAARGAGRGGADERVAGDDGANEGVAGDDGAGESAADDAGAGESAADDAGAGEGLAGARNELELAGAGGDGEFEARQLCSDGNCVGLIGSAGVCKVCGRAADEGGA